MGSHYFSDVLLLEVSLFYFQQIKKPPHNRRLSEWQATMSYSIVIRSPAVKTRQYGEQGCALLYLMGDRCVGMIAMYKVVSARPYFPPLYG
jgi:hypothetical protein